MTENSTRFAFLSSGSPAAEAAISELRGHHPDHPVAECDVIIALGGDGFVLHCLHEYLESGKPIYGMNRGTIGFLLNEYTSAKLPERVAQAHAEELHPLTMKALTVGGEEVTALAFNEVSLLRTSRQSANLRVLVDGQVEMEKLISDGILVATSAGSTAYNLSVNGPVVPIGSDLMALTPISPFRPRRWRGALLPHRATVRIENLDPVKRGVSASADHTEVHDVAWLEVSQVANKSVKMLFDPGHSLNERILREQFAV